VQHVLHETSLAVFDNLEVPVWGRLHDAADYSAAFLLFQFGPDIARKTIFGTAYFLNQWDATIREGQITDVNYLGDIRPTVRQRYYNLLCIAVGKDPIASRASSRSAAPILRSTCRPAVSRTAAAR